MKFEYSSSPALLLIGAMAVSAQGLDWPQWLGPDRNGVCPDKVALSESWPASGPRLLWVSEKIATAGPPGGYGSPVVADGRVFLYVNEKCVRPTPERRLTETGGNSVVEGSYVRPRYGLALDTATREWGIVELHDMEGGLRSLGWVSADKLPPAAILKAVEQARLSDERAKAANPKKREAFVNRWLKGHLSAEDSKNFGAYCADRLYQGKAAFAPDDLSKLTPVKDKLFASQAEFDQALDQLGITPELRQAVVKAAVVDTKKVGKDVVYCFSAADGKTLWRKEYDNLPGVLDFHYASSSTPCVAGGRCFAAGSDGALYCLDVKDGRELWVVKEGKGIQHSSPLVVDGLVIQTSAGGAIAVHVEDGKLAWKQPKITEMFSSPTLWASAGMKYVLCCNAGQNLTCMDLATGDPLWSVPHNGWSTPAIAGDMMVLERGNELDAYRLSPAKPEKLWTVHSGNSVMATIYNGCVYRYTPGGLM